MASGRYSYAQLEQLWINAGGPKDVAYIAAAIALAESGGDPSSNNYTDNNGTQTSWGLWQISDGTHNEPVPNIDDPTVNAQQAVAKYTARGNFSDWGTYDSGAYKQFLNGQVPPSGGSGGSGGGGNSSPPQSATLLSSGPGGFSWIPNPFWDIWNNLFGNPTGGIISAPSGNPLNALGDISKSLATVATDITKLFQWLAWLFQPSSWLRIGAFFVGLVSMAAAFYMFKEAL